MTSEEALKIMCEKHCKNFEMCQGTGCTPRYILKELVDKQKKGGQ